eukprot:9331039-Heterocapsa_arctica.AAC.1
MQFASWGAKEIQFASGGAEERQGIRHGGLQADWSCASRRLRVAEGRQGIRGDGRQAEWCSNAVRLRGSSRDRATACER